MSPCECNELRTLSPLVPSTVAHAYSLTFISRLRNHTPRVHNHATTSNSLCSLSWQPRPSTPASRGLLRRHGTTYVSSILGMPSHQTGTRRPSVTPPLVLPSTSTLRSSLTTMRMCLLTHCTKSAIQVVQSTSSQTLLLGTMDLRVSLPRCRYCAHLSREQVAQFVAPTQTPLSSSTLQSSSISMSYGDSWLTVTGVPCPKPIICSARHTNYTGAQGRMTPPFSAQSAMHSPWCATPTCANGCADDLLRLPAHSDTDIAEALRRSKCGDCIERACKSAFGPLW